MHITNEFGTWGGAEFKKHPYSWALTTVKSILRNRVYLGHNVANK